MSDLLGDLSGVLGSDPGEGNLAYTRGAILWDYASRGQSFNSAIQAMRQAGAGIRNEVALSMWQDIQTTLTEASTAEAIGFDQLASGALSDTPPDNWTGQYTYRVNFTTRTTGAEGDYYLESTPKWFITSSVLTPAEAVELAQTVIEVPAGTGTPDAINPSDVIMANLSGAWYRTQPGILGSV